MANKLVKGFRSVAFALCALPFAAVAAEQLDYWSLNTNAFDFAQGTRRGGFVNDGVFQFYVEISSTANTPPAASVYGMYLDGMTVPEGLYPVDFSKPIKDAATGAFTDLKITLVNSAPDKYRYSGAVSVPTEWLNVIGKVVVGYPDAPTAVSVTGFTSVSNLGEIELKGPVALDGGNQVFSTVKVTNIVGSAFITKIGYECLRNNKGTIPGILDLTGASSIGWNSLGGISAVRVSENLTESKGGLGGKELYGFVPSALRSVGSRAFTSVKFMDLPDGKLELPPEVTDYPYHSGSDSGCFQFCSGVKEVVIPNTVTDIPQQMFHGCVDLEKVTVKAAQLTSIGPKAFTCDKLHQIWYDGAPPPAESISPQYFQLSSYKKGGKGVQGNYAFKENQVTNFVRMGKGWENLADGHSIPGAWSLSDSTVQRLKYYGLGLILLFK